MGRPSTHLPNKHVFVFGPFVFLRSTRVKKKSMQWPLPYNDVALRNGQFENIRLPDTLERLQNRSVPRSLPRMVLRSLLTCGRGQSSRSAVPHPLTGSLVEDYLALKVLQAGGGGRRRHRHRVVVVGNDRLPAATSVFLAVLHVAADAAVCAEEPPQPHGWRPLVFALGPAVYGRLHHLGRVLLPALRLTGTPDDDDAQFHPLPPAPMFRLREMHEALTWLVCQVRDVTHSDGRMVHIDPGYPSELVEAIVQVRLSDNYMTDFWLTWITAFRQTGSPYLSPADSHKLSTYLAAAAPSSTRPGFWHTPAASQPTVEMFVDTPCVLEVIRKQMFVRMRARMAEDAHVAAFWFQILKRLQKATQSAINVRNRAAANECDNLAATLAGTTAELRNVHPLAAQYAPLADDDSWKPDGTNTVSATPHPSLQLQPAPLFSSGVGPNDLGQALNEWLHGISISANVTVETALDRATEATLVAEIVQDAPLNVTRDHWGLLSPAEEGRALAVWAAHLGHRVAQDELQILLRAPAEADTRERVDALARHRRWLLDPNPHALLARLWRRNLRLATRPPPVPALSASHSLPPAFLTAVQCLPHPVSDVLWDCNPGLQNDWVKTEDSSPTAMAVAAYLEQLIRATTGPRRVLVTPAVSDHVPGLPLKALREGLTQLAVVLVPVHWVAGSDDDDTWSLLILDPTRRTLAQYGGGPRHRQLTGTTLWRRLCRLVGYWKEIPWVLGPPPTTPSLDLLWNVEHWVRQNDPHLPSPPTRPLSHLVSFTYPLRDGTGV